MLPRELNPGCRSCVCVSPFSPPFTLGACRGFRVRLLGRARLVVWDKLKRARWRGAVSFHLFFFLNLLTLNMNCDLYRADERGDFCILMNGYRLSEWSAAEMHPHLLQ